MDSSSDDDIWDYRSISRIKPREHGRGKVMSQKTRSYSSTTAGAGKDSANVTKFSTQPCKKSIKKASLDHQNSRGDKKVNKRLLQCSDVKMESKSITKKPRAKANKKRLSTKKSSVVVKSEERTPDNKRMRGDGRCPICQLPFSALPSTQTPSWHIDECLMSTVTAKSECPAGLKCDSTIESHYKKFFHREIARSSKKKQTYADPSHTGNIEVAKTCLTFDDSAPESKAGELVCNGRSPQQETLTVIEISSDTEDNEGSVTNSGIVIIDAEVSTESDNYSECTVDSDKNMRDSSKAADRGIGQDRHVSRSKGFDSDKEIENINVCETSANSQEDDTGEGNSDSEEDAVREIFENLENNSLSNSILDLGETLHSIRDVSDMLQDALDNNDNPSEREVLSDDSHLLLFECSSESNCENNVVDGIDGSKDEEMGMSSEDENMNQIQNISSLRPCITSVDSIDLDHYEGINEDPKTGLDCIHKLNTDERKQNSNTNRNRTKLFHGTKRSHADNLQTSATNESHVNKTKKVGLNDKGKCTENSRSEKCENTFNSMDTSLCDELFESSGRSDIEVDRANACATSSNETRPVIIHKANKRKEVNVKTKHIKSTITQEESKSISNKSNSVGKNRSRTKPGNEEKGQKSIESFFLSKAKRIRTETEIKTVHECRSKSNMCISEPKSKAKSDNLQKDKITKVKTSLPERYTKPEAENRLTLVPHAALEETEPYDSLLTEEWSSPMPAGFFPETGATDDELSQASDSKFGYVRNTQETSQSGHTSSYMNTASSSLSDRLDDAIPLVHKTVTEKVAQITKNAADILRASSKLLFKQIAQTAVPVSYMLKGGGNRNATQSQRGRGNGCRGGNSTVPTATSDETIMENTSGSAGKRKCPFYKKIPGTYLTVDAFRYGEIPDCKAYILSHFHYDHYGGLTKAFKQPIYCSQITANLVKQKIKVDGQYLHPVPLWTPRVVENVEITFLEANHCPGAVLILFKLRTGKVYLHTGDFRANTDMEDYPQLKQLRIDALYLDTTYCDPQYSFPPQQEVIRYTVKLVKDTLSLNPNTLIVCGSYTIGKEKIFTAIANLLNCKICVMREKKSVLDCLEDKQLKCRVSLNWDESRLHVLPMNKMNPKGLLEHLTKQGKKYDSVLGIEPTGWTFSKKLVSLAHIQPKVNRDGIKIYGVPYSEHSSFLELKRFVQFTRPDKILPTVNNGNVHSRRKMEIIFEAWREEVGRKIK